MVNIYNETSINIKLTCFYFSLGHYKLHVSTVKLQLLTKIFSTQPQFVSSLNWEFSHRHWFLNEYKTTMNVFKHKTEMIIKCSSWKSNTVNLSRKTYQRRTDHRSQVKGKTTQEKPCNDWWDLISKYCK